MESPQITQRISYKEHVLHLTVDCKKEIHKWSPVYSSHRRNECILCCSQNFPR